MPQTPIESTLPPLPIGPFLSRRAHPAVSPTRPVFTEFYCQSGGSNLNSCSDTNNTALYTSTNGNWSTATNIFIPTDGTNPYTAGVRVGMYASIYPDAATVGVYIVRIIGVVNAANGAITTDSAVSAGSAPSTLTSGRTIKVGGAGQGASGATGIYPLSLSGFGNLTSSTTAGEHRVRLNMKNDATYSITTSFAPAGASGAPFTVQGYTNVPGDTGKATIDGGNSTNAIISSSAGVSGTSWLDLIFTSSTNSATAMITSGNTIFFRCVISNAYGVGISAASGITLIECEFYNCNRSNAALSSALNSSCGSNVTLVNRCFFHGNVGSANAAIWVSNSCVISNCIFKNNNWGFTCTNSFAGNGIAMNITNCDFYKNISDGIHYPPGSGTTNSSIYVENCNFVQNGGAGIFNPNTDKRVTGYVFNCANFGNQAPDMLGDIIEPFGRKTYSASPYRDPDNGDLSIILVEAIGAGRGNFTETQGSLSAPNTVGYPDIGAAQAQNAVQSWSAPNTTQILSPGYLNHVYNWKWGFSVPTTVTVQSGTIPPGLLFQTVNPSQIQIIGTPTTIGTYLFILRATIGAAFADSTFQLQILDDPDEGIGGIICG